MAEEASDAARWWQAYSLAENYEVDELRQRADAGDDHALYELAGWLAAHGRLTELRELVSTEGGLAALQAFWRTWQVDLEVLRLLAQAGDNDAQRQLAHWLTRSGDASN